MKSEYVPRLTGISLEEALVATEIPSALSCHALARLSHLSLSRRAVLAGLLATMMLAFVKKGRTGAQPATPAASALLPRDVILPVEAVQDVIPEIASEIDTGPNDAVGRSIANRAVIFASADGVHRVVLSVDQYPSASAAQRSFDEAVETTRDVPGVTTEAMTGLGEAALIGVATQGEETHVGGGALFGALIVSATLQMFDGTEENKDNVAELIQAQAEYAATALGLSPAATPTS